MEKMMHTLLPVHHYRCHDCNWRGIRFQRRTLRVALFVVAGLGVGLLLYEVAAPVIKVIVYLLLSQ